MRTFYLFFLSLFPLNAQDVEPEKMGEERMIDAAGSPRIVKEGVEQDLLIEGITLVNAGTHVDDVIREHGIVIQLNAEETPGLVKLLRPFLNHPLDEIWLENVKQTITQYFKEQKGIHVTTIVPIQDVLEGVVILQVFQGKIGKINFTGQKWFPEKGLRKTFGVKEGDPLSEKTFLNDLSWLNRNPFHKSKMILIPSVEQEKTDLLLMTKDYFPFRAYIGGDNTGFQSNGQYRIFAGFNWGDAFFVQDLLSYQYTASPNFHNFQSHVANYLYPFSWKHLLSIFGCYGTVYPVIPSFESSGVNIQISGRYQIPIPPLYGRYLNQVDLGFDYKYLTSNLFFVGDTVQSAPIPGVPDAPIVTRNSSNYTNNTGIEITQFMLSYDFQRTWSNQSLEFNVEMYLSPWKDVFNLETTQAYNEMRPFSHVRYAYWKLFLEDQLQIASGWSFRSCLRAQVATGTLPTSEQFGLGGYDTVRGYFEQQFVADDALCLNFELYAPVLSLFKRFQNSLACLAFIDYGYGYNYSAITPVFIKQNLLGIGPGLRYSMGPYLNARLDYGFQVFGIPQDYRLGRFHFSLITSY